MFKELEDRDVSILVNNVGCTFFGKFEAHQIKDCMSQVNVNINAQTYMTRFLLPKLLKRERSAIVDISSCLAVQDGNENLPVYTATKAYNRAFSQSI